MMKLIWGHKRSAIIKGRMVCISWKHLSIVVEERRHFPSRVSIIHILRLIIFFIIRILGLWTLGAFLIFESNLFLLDFLLYSPAFRLKTVLWVSKIKIKWESMNLLFERFFFRKFFFSGFWLLFSILFLSLILRWDFFTDRLER